MNLSHLVSRLTLLTAAIAAVAAAQDKATVPLSSPNQPATVKAHVLSGNIAVTVGTGSQVVVESEESRGRQHAHSRNDTPPPGMHRIDPGAGGVNVEEDHNVVTIRPALGNGDLKIEVPANTSLELKTLAGGRVEVSGISGDLDVECINGQIDLKNVSGSVVAHTINGSLTVSMDRVAPGKPMSFTSLNGKVDVTVPADTKAKLRLKTSRGSIYSDFDVKVEPDGNKPVIEDSKGKGGKYRIRVDRGVTGSINGGGPEFLFQTMNGDILIHKK